MTRRDEHAGSDELADEVCRSGQLGGERHQPHMREVLPTRALEHRIRPVSASAVRRDYVLNRVAALLLGSDEWAFKMHAENRRAVDRPRGWHELR